MGITVRVTDRDQFLDFAWEIGWLDERFGDDPSVDPDPNELLENVLMTGFARASDAGEIVTEDGVAVPGAEVVPPDQATTDR